MASHWSSLRHDAEPGLLPGPDRRYLALHLPRWATDCLKRADPTLAGLTRPLVLWEKQKGAMRIVALDLAASAAGLFMGQSLSDARAICPVLEACEIDQALTAHIFGDFADWHSNASPVVGVLTDMAPYGDLVLDITGVSHLFGGEAAMLDTLIRRLQELGYTVAGAVAPSIGAAWALAHYHPGQVIAGDPGPTLARLPVAALRLEETQVAGLTQMGLKSIGQLYGRNRRALVARFGASLILRLDQALGHINERLVPRLPPIAYYAERRFAEPIGLMDDVQMTARDLALRLGLELERGGHGAQAFHLFLYRVDHKLITLTVNAARATRDAGHIARLFLNRAERLGGEYDAGFGIDMIRLAASSVSPLDATQAGVFEAGNNTENLARLYDRMTSRLGPLSVVRSRPVDTHIPELAMRLEPVIASGPDPSPPLAVLVPRPLRLLPQPEPITVLAEVPDAPPASMIWRRVSYRFVKSSGPERIAAEWRQAGQKLKLTAHSVEQAAVPDTAGAYFEEGEKTRDYYIAEDDGGRRFWLFRLGLFDVAQTPSWYLHGFFA